MSEAAAALVHFAFTSDCIATLHSSYHVDNPNSGRILRKLGFIETRTEQTFSLAQRIEVPSKKLHLTAEAWAAQQKSRAA